MTTGKFSPAVFLIACVLFLVSAVGSYAAVTFFDSHSTIGSTEQSTSTTTKNSAKKKLDLPKTEECPLSGAMFSKPERDAWEKRRPLGVMIDNSKQARPQSGLSFADVVYEAVAEGGITRFMGMFYCQEPDYIGPVRSARTYYLDWLSEYGNSPLYDHVGGANSPGPANALGQITQYGWRGYNDLDYFSVGFPAHIEDRHRITPNNATEHSKYTQPLKLWELAATKRGLTNVEIDDKTGKELSWDEGFEKWTFKEDLALGERPEKLAVSFNFSGIDASYLGDYVALWKYDSASNSLLRFTGGQEHRDINTNQQILAKNVVIQFMVMSIADDDYNEEGHGSHTLYTNKGKGKAMFIVDGAVTDGTWAKSSRLARTQFFDSKGLEMKFNRGQTWIETLPVGQKVNIE